MQKLIRILRKPMAVMLVLAMVLCQRGGIKLRESIKAASHGLSNPVTDNNKVTTWDCIYFGKYWQNDTNANGTADTNDEKEPIKWRVLSVDGDDAFLLADQNLVAKEYNTSSNDVTWENCTLRSWLNGYDDSFNADGIDYSENNFLDDAFSEEEQSLIMETEVVNKDNPYYGTEGGRDTKDKIYLLSIEEVCNVSYGFKSEYQDESKKREAQNTEFTKASKGMTSTDKKYEGNGWWFLRSLGVTSRYASYVNFYGYGCEGSDIDNDRICVRPVLHLNLAFSELWSYAGKVTLGRDAVNGEIPTSSSSESLIPSVNSDLDNPVTDSAGVTTWDCIYFGNYWQSDTNGDGTANEEDAKEPIKWRVLSVDGDDAFLLADKNLDASYFAHVSNKITWENCAMRSWLNGYSSEYNSYGKDYSVDNFLDEAFDKDEQAAIIETEVVNRDNPDYGTEGGENTRDKIYLLSIEEVCNTRYGFNSEFFTSSNTREVKNTSYAEEACGAWTSTLEEYEGNGLWWLRSPGETSTYVAGIYNYGGGHSYSYTGCARKENSDISGTDWAYVGIRPVLHLNLSSSELWSYGGKVSANEGTISHQNWGLRKPYTDGDSVTTWDCVYFGSYLQSDTNGDGKINANDTKEPIKWRVLSVDGDKAFLLADQNLDLKVYNVTDMDVTWETCTLRSWLNGYSGSSNACGIDYSSDNFLNNAFSSKEQNAICNSAVINANNFYSGTIAGTEGGNDTRDKVYLLSIAEAKNELYGFSNVFNIMSKTREAKNSSYVTRCLSKISTTAKEGENGSWWLRSPGSGNDAAAEIAKDGYGSCNMVDAIYSVVRPVLHLDLRHSSYWSYAGTVNSAGEIVSSNPIVEPTIEPTAAPTVEPTIEPTIEPTSTSSSANKIYLTEKRSYTYVYKGTELICKFRVKSGILSWNYSISNISGKEKKVKVAGIVKKSKNIIFITKNSKAYIIDCETGKKKFIAQNVKKLVKKGGYVVEVKRAKGKNISVKNI